jgi:Carboxypeptidase regulatory-like domain
MCLLIPHRLISIWLQKTVEKYFSSQTYCGTRQFCDVIWLGYLTTDDFYYEWLINFIVGCPTYLVPSNRQLIPYFTPLARQLLSASHTKVLVQLLLCRSRQELEPKSTASLLSISTVSQSTKPSFKRSRGERMKFLKARFLVVLLLASTLFGWGHAAYAQSVYAAIHGTITDTSGAVVPNATVTVLNTSTGIPTTTKSDGKGYYTLPQLQVGGPYSITITAAGFKSAETNGLNLNANDNRDVDAKLEIGASSTTIQVDATSLQVETADSQLKQVVTAEQLEQIPLLGRDATGLQKLQPGVVESSDRFGSFSTNGSQTPQNSYLLNGTDINDGPLQNEGISVNPDALQEENIISSTLNPEFARNSGATVNQIIKSGSNRFHGSAYEFYRDTFLNNGNYFSQTRPQFHQNIYGGQVGGPVIHDKLFGFLAYQGLRNRTGATTNAQTFSPAQFAGDFNADTNFQNATGNNAGGLSSNPLPFALGSCAKGTPWNQCFAPGSVQIPQNEWDPLASALTKKYVPASNFSAGGASFYNFNANNTAAEDQGIIRVDYTPTSRDTIWASTVFQSSPATSTLAFGGGSFPGFGTVQSAHFKIFSASYTHSFSTSMINELRAGYFRFNFPSVIPATPMLPSSAGFNITPQDSSSPGLPYIQVGQYFSIGNSFEGPQPRLDSNLSYGDNFTKIIGGHSLKFGASYEQFRVDNPFSYLNNGSYSYSGGSQYSSGDPAIDFLIGIPDGYEQTNNGQINTLAAEVYAFAQDSWKVTSDFTLNYGIAWDVEQPNKNAQDGGLGINCWENSSAESTVFPGAPPGLGFPGDPGCNRAGGPTSHYNRFGPRIGFAWSPSSGPSKLIGPSGSHDFSIRGGYGIYYNRDQQEQSLQNLEDPPFFFVSRGAGDFGGVPSFANPFVDVAGNGSEANPFPFATPHAGQVIDWQNLYALNELATFDPKSSVPYVQNFNLNIQRSLPSSMVLQIGYVGSLGRRLASWYEGDNVTPAGHDACLAGATLPGYPAANTCNTSFRNNIGTYFPQFMAQPAIVPGTGGGAIPSLPNGLPWYTTVARQNTEDASNYNALQISVIKARTHGLSATFAYTYSHGLDNGSGYESGTGSNNRVQIFTPGFTYLNYGDSDYDARHRFATSYIYEVPMTASMKEKPFLRAALAGWEIAGVTALQTGFPVGIEQGSQRSLWCSGSYFGCGDTPNTSNFHIKSLNPRASQNPWFDTSSFSDEQVGTFGNVKRNFFHGPGFNYTNLQVAKNIHLSADGQRYIQLRLEAFNAFNHANFSNPDGNFADKGAGFGSITSVDQSLADPNGDPQPGRAVQLAGKFYF